MRALSRFLRRRRRLILSRQGFTLVEVLVVMVILSIGILPLALVQTRARAEVQEADNYTRAVTIAQREMESAKGMGFANAVADSGFEDGIRWHTAIADVDMGLRQVDVAVIFNQGGTPDTLRVVCLLSMR